MSTFNILTIGRLLWETLYHQHLYDDKTYEPFPGKVFKHWVWVGRIYIVLNIACSIWLTSFMNNNYWTPFRLKSCQNVFMSCCHYDVMLLSLWRHVVYYFIVWSCCHDDIILLTSSGVIMLWWCFHVATVQFCTEYRDCTILYRAELNEKEIGIRIWKGFKSKKKSFLWF